MRVLRQQAGQEQDRDQGRWFVYGKDPESQEQLELRVRRLPPAEERQIEFRISGHKRTTRFVKGGREMVVDLEKAIAEGLAKASAAMVDSKGFEVDIADAATAAVYAELLGVPSVATGMLCLDGKWNDRLKRHVLDQLPELITWIGTKSESLKLQAAEDEEGKD